MQIIGETRGDCQGVELSFSALHKDFFVEQTRNSAFDRKPSAYLVLHVCHCHPFAAQRCPTTINAAKMNDSFLCLLDYVQDLRFSLVCMYGHDF